MDGWWRREIEKECYGTKIEVKRRKILKMHTPVHCWNKAGISKVIGSRRQIPFWGMDLFQSLSPPLPQYPLLLSQFHLRIQVVVTSGELIKRTVSPIVEYSYLLCSITWPLISHLGNARRCGKLLSKQSNIILHVVV